MKRTKLRELRRTKIQQQNWYLYTQWLWKVLEHKPCAKNDPEQTGLGLPRHVQACFTMLL